ncbi:MAG: DUF4352 domain-containing protein [Anaerolineae bacterium]|nr:DUF4352 domain-containing protein [Anaerolineae bacterium]
MADNVSAQPDTPNPEPVSPPTDASPAAAPELPLLTGSAPKRRISILPIVGIAIVGFIILAIVVGWAIASLIGPQDSAGIPLQVTRIASTSPLTTPIPPSSAAPIAEVGDTRVSLPFPTRLDVADRSFPVQSAAAEVNPWSSPFPAGAAVWVPGTVINYVVGLEPTADNQSLIAGLQQEAPIVFALSNGTRLTFRVSGSQQVAANAPEVFAQSRLQLTLVLPLEGDTWTVVTADFEAALEPTSAPGGAAAAIGQAVQVGDAQVTVTEASVRTGATPTQPGTMIYVVEFSVLNTGALPLNPDVFFIELQDGLGNAYLLSQSASQTGRNGPLTAPVQPGAQASGSAGYIVPDSLTGPTLMWRFSPERNSELRALFGIPYAAETSADPAVPDIYVYEAFISESEETMHVLADVYNDGGDAFTVEESDISLSCNSGLASLQTTAPPLPWTVPGGDGREMELVFDLPGEFPCVVTIRGFTFEITD